MYLLCNEKNPSGGYPPILRSLLPINGHTQVNCDTAIFYRYNGFVTPTIESEKVVGFTPNMEAWEAWKASLPESEPQPPKLTEIQKLQLAVAELGTTTAQSKTDMQLAIAELAATMGGAE